MNTKTGHILQELTNFAIIPHICSTTGSFDTVFAKKISAMYPEVKKAYFKLGRYVSGEIQPVRAASRLIIVNMVCMEGNYSETNLRPVALHHLKECLYKVKEFANNMDLKVHIPAINCVPKCDLESVSKIISEVSPDFTVWHTPKKEVADTKKPVSINLNQILSHGTANQTTFRLSRKETHTERPR